jgi:hypothetical protein
MFFDASLPTTNLSLPAGFGSAATNINNMFFNASLPTTNLSLPAGFGSLAQDMSSMFRLATLPDNFVLPAGFGSLATNISNMFFDASLPTTNLSLPAGFGGLATNMSGSFSYVNLPNGFSLPAGFGSLATNMSNMFDEATLPAGFVLPAGFGSQATNMTSMFNTASLPDNFVLPAQFGQVATNMVMMFNDATLTGNIDWTGTDLTNSSASKGAMFSYTKWNDHFILVANIKTRDFLITYSSISDNTRIEIKSSTLKIDTNQDMFFDINSPSRSQITKISFQQTVPICANPTDLSNNNDNSIIACVVNSTEILIGSNNLIKANADSSYLFCGLGKSNEATIDLNNFNTSSITNMKNMFYGSKLNSILNLPSDFGGIATNMSNMFINTKIPNGFNLPSGFGNIATNMGGMFMNTALPDNFVLPAGFGSAATNMATMFQTTSLPAGFILPDGFGSAATTMSSIFSRTNLPANFVLPNGFGNVATSMRYMFDSVSLPTNFSLPEGFGQNATQMYYMFSNTTLNGNINWFRTDLSGSTADKTNMFRGTKWNGYVIWVQNIANQNTLITDSGATDLNIKAVWLKLENYNPDNFLSIPNITRSQISKVIFSNTLPTCDNPADVSFNNSKLILACVNGKEITVGQIGGVVANANSQYLFSNLTISTGVAINFSGLQYSSIESMAGMFSQSTLSDSFILPTGFGDAALDMNNMFYNASLPTTSFSLPNGFGGVATDMNGMFSDASLPTTSFILPNGFGGAAIDMTSMWQAASLPADFVLPAGFGSAATSMGGMFFNATLPTTSFSLPAGFGSAATSMTAMFLQIKLRADIDWSSTNLGNSTAFTVAMFNGVFWNNHVFWVRNLKSQTYLTTNTGASVDNIKIKDLPTLKVETAKPTTFLGIQSPTRQQMTKLSFVNYLPSCSNPTDVSNNNSGSILACVNGTEITVGQKGGVNLNKDSKYLFSNFRTSSPYVTLDTTYLEDIATENMSYMFYNSYFNSDSNITLTNNFGNSATNMQDMFAYCIVAKEIVFPAKFGSVATNMRSMFDTSSSLVRNYIVLPNEFGSLATNISNMFSYVNFTGENSFKLPENLGKSATSMAVMFRHANLTNLAPFPANFGKNVSDMLGMFEEATFGKSLSNFMPTGFGSTATDMSRMFNQAKFTGAINLIQGFGTRAQNMSYMFAQTDLTNGINFPNGFGDQATNTSHMFSQSKLARYFSIPGNLGKAAQNMREMFYFVNLPDTLGGFPAGFGQSANDMSYMFYGASFNHSDFDWTNTDFAWKDFPIESMFRNVKWNGNVIYVDNPGSVTFFTDTRRQSGATTSNIWPETY